MIFEEAARDYIGRSKEPIADIESALDHADIVSLSKFARYFYDRGAKDAKLRDELNNKVQHMFPTYPEGMR